VHPRVPHPFKQLLGSGTTQPAQHRSMAVHHRPEHSLTVDLAAVWVVDLVQLAGGDGLVQGMLMGLHTGLQCSPPLLPSSQ
jgi:hypothetical protein